MLLAKISRMGIVVASLWLPSALLAELRVGTSLVDVSPTQLPVLVNGGMLSREATSIKAPVYARAVVLDDGRETIGIVVVDSCMMPRDLLDEAKHLAAAKTQLKPDRILISATHTHTAPSCMGALGTEADDNYVPLLRQKLAEALVAASANLEPAEVGWASGNAADFTAVRRWVRRPDRIDVDPFGNASMRANMHAARKPDDAVGPTGPEDPELSMIGFRSPTDGRVLAVLSNFSMHYYGDQPISPDYFGLYCRGIESLIAPSKAEPARPLALMSHGCSGDIWRRDYFLPADQKEPTIDEYTNRLLVVAKGIYGSMTYESNSYLAMAEARLAMRYRIPDAQRLEWAKRIVAEMGERPAKTNTEVYAREQILLHERQSTEIVLQAVRIGNIAIATTPNETYALTGIKLKLQSPMPKTMVIELANGGDGYIPPPEQHPLGGYNTWAARTAGLETTAEPKIVATDLRLLEQVCEKPRRTYKPSLGPIAKAVLAAKPQAYWRLDEFVPGVADDASGHDRQAAYEPGILPFLEGDDSSAFVSEGEVNRSAHFAGGRLVSRRPHLDGDYSIVFSAWNGMPIKGRGVTGWMFSRDLTLDTTSNGIHLGLGGTDNEPGKLLLQIGTARVLGKSVLERWLWAQLALVRDGDHVRVYRDGVLEIDATAPKATNGFAPTLYFGGRSDNEANWEGKLDEIAVFDRALDESELKRLIIARPADRVPGP